MGEEGMGIYTPVAKRPSSRLRSKPRVLEFADQMWWVSFGKTR